MSRIYCHGRLVGLRLIGEGYGVCLGCGHKLKVVW